VAVLETLTKQALLLSATTVLLGARSEIVEGVVVEDGCVISMGVYIGQSTKIFNRMTGDVSFGAHSSRISVVSGNLPSADGSYSLSYRRLVDQAG